MELAELIAAVKAAATKDDLESLVKTELSLDLDKRKTLKTLRAEVLKGLGETAEEGDDEDSDDTNGTTGEGSDPAGSTSDTAGASAETPAAAMPAPAVTSEPSPGTAPAPVTPPDLEEGPEPEIPPAVGNRLLRHKVTGRNVLWTSALAKLADLEEV